MSDRFSKIFFDSVIGPFTALNVGKTHVMNAVMEFTEKSEEEWLNLADVEQKIKVCKRELGSVTLVIQSSYRDCGDRALTQEQRKIAHDKMNEGISKETEIKKELDELVELKEKLMVPIEGIIAIIK